MGLVPRRAAFSRNPCHSPVEPAVKVAAADLRLATFFDELPKLDFADRPKSGLKARVLFDFALRLAVRLFLYPLRKLPLTVIATDLAKSFEQIAVPLGARIEHKLAFVAKDFPDCRFIRLFAQ